MISIIICNRNKFYLEQIQKNIYETIGVEFELIIIDNQKNDYNIFQAYNIGVEKSKGEILCFAHEDIIFHTMNWGEKVVKHFTDEKTGMIGISGGNAFPNCPAPWWNSTLLNDHLGHIIQHWKEGFGPKNDPFKKPIEGLKNVTYDYHNPFSEVRTKAVILDGVWMCAPKHVFEKCKFDEETFKDFHCYDTDICFQIGQFYSIYVVFDILIEHFSMGKISKSWAQAAEILVDKWIPDLPKFEKVINKNVINQYNSTCLLTYCYWIQEMGINDKKIREIIIKYLKPYSLFSKSSETRLLWIWSKFGNKIARIQNKIIPFKNNFC